MRAPASPGSTGWRRRALHDPDDVTLGVGEERDRGLRRDLGERHDHLAPARGDLVEHGLRVVRVDVERHMARAAVGRWRRCRRSGRRPGGTCRSRPDCSCPGSTRTRPCRTSGALSVLAGDFDMNDCRPHGTPPAHLGGRPIRSALIDLRRTAPGRIDRFVAEHVEISGRLGLTAAAARPGQAGSPARRAPRRARRRSTLISMISCSRDQVGREVLEDGVELVGALGRVVLPPVASATAIRVSSSIARRKPPPPPPPPPPRPGSARCPSGSARCR